PELMLRREVLVMDGKVLRQQLAASELAPGSFYVDAAARTITLSPPGGKDPAHAVCEVATRSIALHLAGRKNVILRGLVFRHDASLHAAPLCAPLQISSCNNVVVEDCQFSANNNKGIYLGGSQNHNITIRNSRFNGNGCIGLNAANCTNLLIEGCETNLNNWRGNWAGVYRRWPCGLKVSRSNRVTIRIHRSIRNMATGGWIDLENRDVRVEDSIFYGNYRGLHLEAGEGPYLVQRCQIAANRQEPLINEWRWSFGSGLVLTHARGVMLKNNLIFDNDVAQVGVRDDRDKHVFRDPVSGVIHEWYTERVSLKNNTIIATDANPTLLRLPSKDFDGGRFWQQFRASDNNYFGMRHAKAFVIGAGAGLGEACSAGQSGLGSCNGSYTFDEWRNASGQDAGAHFNDGDVADLSPPDGLVT
ncbi:MAG: right-handed parallel beta-helix repeat-containing protein, partial [Hyphomicrobiaceae bacterium]|nr:right-handed parallel beta-helix repeat-containing protein [Hyphomicrobiaceae bacterium]